MVPGGAATPTHIEALDAVALAARDAEALDALVEHGFSMDALDAERLPEARRLARLLQLLDVGDAGRSRSALIDATLARIARADHPAGSSAAPALCADDQEALEALVSAGCDSQRVPRVLRSRAERIGRLLSLLDEPVQAPFETDVRQATLARVREAVAGEESRLVLSAAEPPAGDARGRWFRPRLADLISVAALLVIGGSVLLPMLGAMRQYAGRVSCASGMQAAGVAFNQYSADHGGNWAMASASPAGAMWWNFGQRDESNSANLFTIARTGYSDLDNLACPGNEHAVRGEPAPGDWDWDRIEQISYAYQNLFAQHRPDISGSVRVVIIADKSPVVVLSRQHRKIDPFANSPNHGGRGQNVLFSDGRVVWTRSPVLDNGDNLWLPRPIEQMIRSALAEPLSGHESPASADDVMAIP